MTKEDIIRMAREAGAVFPADGSYHKFEFEGSLERFAALVAAAEREACAKVVEDVDPSPNPIINMTNRLAAAAIRARSNT